MKRLPEGLLIAIEGIDGAGKTSVAGALTQWCGERGLACHMSKEPTGVFVGEKLRRSAQLGRLSLDDELDLFILDRREHVKRTIEPGLSERAVIILDRYYYSTAAYQGARGADPAKIIEANEAFAPRPDLVLLLDSPVATGRQRIGMRGEEPNEFEQVHGLETARRIFLDQAGRNKNIVVIDATRSMKEVLADCIMYFKKAAVQKIADSAVRQFGIVQPDHVNMVLELFGASPISDDPKAVTA
jgi:dTMP kinase